MGVLDEQKAQSYHKGQIWNREEESKKIGKFLLFKFLVDNYVNASSFNFYGFFENQNFTIGTRTFFQQRPKRFDIAPDKSFDTYFANPGNFTFRGIGLFEFDVDSLKAKSQGERYFYWVDPSFGTPIETNAVAGFLIPVTGITANYSPVTYSQMSIALNNRSIVTDRSAPNYWLQSDTNEPYQRGSDLKLEQSLLTGYDLVFAKLDPDNVYRVYEILIGKFARAIRIDLNNPKNTRFVDIAINQVAYRRSDLSPLGLPSLPT